jgi:hypothetical protein
MTEPPLSDDEKKFIHTHFSLTPRDLARNLNRLYRDHNSGKRSALIIRFYKTRCISEFLAKNPPFK